MYGNNSAASTTLDSGSSHRHLARLGESTRGILSFQREMVAASNAPIGCGVASETSLDQRVVRTKSRSRHRRSRSREGDSDCCGAAVPSIISVRKSKSPPSKRQPRARSSPTKEEISPARTTGVASPPSPPSPMEISLPSLDGTSFHTRNQHSAVMDQLMRSSHSVSRESPRRADTTAHDRENAVITVITGQTETSTPTEPTWDWDRTSLTLAPGRLTRMVGVEEALYAYQINHCNDTTCAQCETFLYCIDTASMVICPSCQFISPVSSGDESKKQDEILCIGLTVDTILEVCLLSE